LSYASTRGVIYISTRQIARKNSQLSGSDTTSAQL